LDYDTVLDLDKRIRDFPIPESLRNKDINSRPIVMQRASVSTALEAGTAFPVDGIIIYLTSGTQFFFNFIVNSLHALLVAQKKPSIEDINTPHRSSPFS